MGTLEGAHPGNIPVQEGDVARTRPQLSANEIEQGRFTRTIGAYDSPALTLEHLQIDIAHSGKAAKIF